MSDDDEFRVHRIRPARKPGQKTPAELVEDLKKKFGGGGRRGNNGSGNGSGGNPSSAPILALVGAVLILIGFWTSFHKVEYTETGVVTRFGRYVRSVEPGPHFILPFGIERLYAVQTSVVLQEEFGFRTLQARDGRSVYDKQRYKQESLMLTGDLNVADVEWTVQYKIDDAWKFLFHARDVPRNIRDVSMSIMRRVVGDMTVSDVLTKGRTRIENDARKLTQELLDSYDLGIAIDNIVLQDVHPPEKVKAAFDEVNEAKQEQEKIINQAERGYNKVIPEARGKADQLIADAEAYAIDVVNRAKGDAAKFRSIAQEYKKAPKITKKRLYLEAMEEIFTEADNLTIVDDRVKGLLPLFGNMGQGSVAKP